MKQIIDILEDSISKAIKEATGLDNCPAIVRLAANPKFGDYQANGIMAAAKKLKTNPRQLAEKVVAALDISDICQELEIAGPGFINIKLSNSFIAEYLAGVYADTQRMAIEEVKDKQKIVVDFSGPNIAKQMHVGHLRSTIIGDCICRMLKFLGYDVTAQNHIGDWGTQFGMLITYLRDENPEVIENPQSVHIADLEQFYKDAKAKSDQDEDFASRSRQAVVSLHNYDKETIKIWQHIVEQSRKHYQPIYNRLNVKLSKSDERGESFYKDMLAETVNELIEKALAKKSDGAVCVFPEGFKNKQGQPLPFIIQKTDGAFLYATTDLAALKYRVKELDAQKIIYVTDARQSLHFQMLFATVKMANWVKDDVELKHITFGTMLGENGKPFKTRSGENIKLKDLLDEAVQRATVVVEEKNPDLPDSVKKEIASAVGIGAVKYSDYSNNRDSDYVFSFDKMLAMEGNTAPYMQYAYARVKSIQRKAQDKGINISDKLADISKLNMTQLQEIELAKHLLRYGEAIAMAAKECRPNFLTTYLYTLAQKFSSFYSSCPVLIAEKQYLPVRLLLCELTARTIKHGLEELLGIKVVEQM